MMCCSAFTVATLLKADFNSTIKKWHPEEESLGSEARGTFLSGNLKRLQSNFTLPLKVSETGTDRIIVSAVNHQHKD